MHERSPEVTVRCIEGCGFGWDQFLKTENRPRLVGRYFWKKVSDWNETVGAVLPLIDRPRHSQGLWSAKAHARQRMATYLQKTDTSQGGVVQWDRT